MVVYDVANLDTFGNVRRWLQEIEQNCDDVVRILGEWCKLIIILLLYNLLIVLVYWAVCLPDILWFAPSGLMSDNYVSVGNKCDSPDKKVTTEEGKALASQMDIPFFETSAKDNLNIETVIFKEFVMLCDKF